MRPDPDVHPDANPLYAHRCYGGRIERWHPVPAASATKNATGLTEGIFQPPGFVAVDGSVFDLRAEGVYRFYRLPRLSEQRIVWHGELDSLLSMLGYLWVYGWADDPIESHVALAAVRRRVIVAACHCLTHLAVAVLASAGVTARPVALASLGQWGGRDDGHTLVEVRSSEAGWFLYDPSFNICFMEDERRLSLVGTVESLSRWRARLERLAGNQGHGSFYPRRLGHTFWMEERRESGAILYDWYCRLAGVPLVGDEGTYFFPADEFAADDRERLARRYRAMHRDAFMDRFYGCETSQNAVPPTSSNID